MKLRNLTASPYEVVLADNSVVIVPAFGTSDDIDLREDFQASLNLHAWEIVDENDTVSGGGGDDTIDGEGADAGGDNDQVVPSGDDTADGQDGGTVADEPGGDTLAGDGADTVAGDGAAAVAAAGAVVDVSKHSKKEMIALLDKENIYYTTDMDLKDLRAAYQKFKNI